MRERTDLDKKPIWYLFLAANVTVLLGCAITWILCTRPNFNYNTVLIPGVVCNIAALLMCGVFIWFEAKNTMPKAVHFQRKWLYWYLASMIVFIVAIIFNFIYIFIYRNNRTNPDDIRQWSLIIYFVITGVLTLVSIGLQRYARFKIDLDIYRRTHGELPKKEEMEKDKAKLEKQNDDQQMPSSGLADTIDKQ
ncbi:MAG: DUF5453 family protein [Mycoplasmoidaceae bacterium]